MSDPRYRSSFGFIDLLFNLLIGLIKPDFGKVYIANTDATNFPIYIRTREFKIGYVPQRLNLDPTLPISVGRFMRLTERLDRSTCESYLKKAGVAGLIDQQMSELSGGQFQRVLLARALLGNPDILILDEATQGLDQPGSADFYRQIEEVRQSTGCAVLMISHDLHVVMSSSDRVICLNGHICCCGTPESVIATPEYQELFGSGAGGALALYRHSHNHAHDHSAENSKAIN